MDHPQAHMVLQDKVMEMVVVHQTHMEHLVKVVNKEVHLQALMEPPVKAVMVKVVMVKVHHQAHMVHQDKDKELPVKMVMLIVVQTVIQVVMVDKMEMVVKMVMVAVKVVPIMKIM